MSNDGFVPLEEIAEELDVSVQDVETVAFVELKNDEWDEDMERVTPNGRQVILAHFRGGPAPQ